MKLRGKHYRTGDLSDIVWEDGRIVSIDVSTTTPVAGSTTWLAPPFFDLQINGGGGVNFSSGRLSFEEIQRVVALCRSHGIASFCPTLITQSETTLQQGFRTLLAARQQCTEIARAIPVFHLEGPYIAREDGPRGAHPLAHVRLPDWDEFQRLQEGAGGLIRLVTLAPELPGGLPFIEKLVASGCIVAIGHTAATPTIIRDAVRAGARLSTHLGNGSHAMLPRHENYLWEQLDQNELWASVIADGSHLPASLVRAFARLKTPDRLILTCDASSLACLPPGNYREWEQELCILAQGKIIVRDSGFLAGSWHFTDACVSTFLRMTGLELATGIDLAGKQPRTLLRLPNADLTVGAKTGLMLFDWQPGEDIVVRQVIG